MFLVERYTQFINISNKSYILSHRIEIMKISSNMESLIKNNKFFFKYDLSFHYHKPSLNNLHSSFFQKSLVL